MTESILSSIKKLLGGAAATSDHFDPDIIMHINTVLMGLTQIGIGPAEGFFITGDSATWSDFLLEEGKFEAVKTFVYLKVKLVFDPPQHSAHIAAMEKQAAELEWRLNTAAETLNP